MPIYMKVDGIDGNVTAKGHEKWIEIHSLTFGQGRGVTSSAPGQQTNREASTPSFSEVSISKDMDETTPKIFTECCIGKSKKIEIHVCRTGDTIDKYMEYTFTDTLFSSYSVSADGGRSHPVENISLNFSKIEMKYTPYTDDNKAGTPVPAGYDLVTGTKV